MTETQIKEIALKHSNETRIHGVHENLMTVDDAVEAIREAVNAERERCAKICDDKAKLLWDSELSIGSEIRAFARAIEQATAGECAAICVISSAIQRAQTGQTVACHCVEAIRDAFPEEKG